MVIPVLSSVAHELVVRPVGRAGMEARRRRLASEARGRVLEVGAGEGWNPAHYRDVRHVTVLEPDRRRRKLIAARAGAAATGPSDALPIDALPSDALPSDAVPVDVRPVALDEALVHDGAFDTVLCALSLCRLRDPSRALDVTRRALAPEGRLLFLEHEGARGIRGRVQRAVAPVWRRATRGCRLENRTVNAMWEAGFVVTDCERIPLRGSVLRGWLVQGTARVRRRPDPAAVGEGEARP